MTVTTPPRIHFLCEGQTEETVVNVVIAPALAARGITTTHSLLVTKRPAGSRAGFKGGVTSWAKIRNDVSRLLRDPSITLLTTLIDYYGFPETAPGMAERPAGTPHARVACVETALAAEFGDPRFVPHLTLHETETWVLASLDSLESLAGPGPRKPLEAAVAAAGGPELVNDGPSTAPSKRLVAAWPSYSKTSDGPIILADAGLSAALSRCEHARAWFESLVALAKP